MGDRFLIGNPFLEKGGYYIVSYTLNGKREQFDVLANGCLNEEIAKERKIIPREAENASVVLMDKKTLGEMVREVGYRAN